MDLDVAAPGVQCNRAAGIQRDRAKVKGIGPTWLAGIHHYERIRIAGLKRAGDRCHWRGNRVVDDYTLDVSLQMRTRAVVHIVEVPERCPVFLGTRDKSEALALVAQHEDPAAGDLAGTAPTSAPATGWRLRACNAGMGRGDHELIAVRRINLQRIHDNIPATRGFRRACDLIHAHRPVCSARS